MTIRKTSVLKLDEDCHINEDWLKKQIKVIINTCAMFKITVKNIKMCPSRKKGSHFYIYISPPIDAELANQLQFHLGDDCRRVDFNRARIKSGLEEWNKLFEELNVRLRMIYRNGLLYHNNMFLGAEVNAKNS